MSAAPPAGRAGPGELAALALVVAIALGVSAIGPRDRLTWWMEVAPVLVVAPILAATYARFPLTRLLYWLVAFHCLVLILGGHYTYAHVPLGFRIQEALGLARNPYDRIGHFTQGFVPAIAVREILRRVTPLAPGKMLAFLVCCVCLAVSACYEFIEWWAAVALGQGAEEFLGTQGDQWDTQWDMFLALVGAIAAQALLGRVHERQLAAVRPSAMG
jgi:putative membrane protein